MSGRSGRRSGAILLSLLLPAVLAAADALYVKAKRVYPVSGEPLGPATIVLKGGTIAAIEKEAGETPAGAPVVAAEVVIPALIDVLSDLGIEPPLDEESQEVTPRVRIADVFNPAHPSVFQALARGITFAQIAPGSDNVVGGLCALVRTYGPPTRGLIVAEESALRATLGEDPTRGNRSWGMGRPQDIFFRRPTTRMAVFQMFRETFDQGRDAMGGVRETTPDLATIVRALKGELPLLVRADSVIDIRFLLREAERLGLRPTLAGGVEAHAEIDALAARRMSVILTPTAVGLRLRDSGEDVKLFTAAKLAERGIPIALATAGTDVEPLFLGAMAVRHGLPEAAALRSLTLGPAEMLGVGKERGSIEPGKVADLVGLSGEPFAATTRVVFVVGNGQVVFPKGGR